MSTLHHLELAVIDMTERMRRELQFSSDAKKQIRDAFSLLHDALETAEKAVHSAIDERMLALSAAIGNGKPNPETVDSDHPVRKPKLVKATVEAAEPAEAAE